MQSRTSLLYGRTRSNTARGIILAGVLFTVSFLFWRLPDVSNSAYDILPVDVIGGGFVALLLIATVQAYYNEGLLVSWLLVTLPAFGATINHVGVGLTSPDPLTTVGLVVGIPVVIGFVVGTSGFLVGRSVRCVILSARSN
jgi:hypothetical protein